MRKLPVLPANNEYMGVWMHGIEEDEMWFFMACAGVPCFLVHKLTAEEPRGEMVTQSFTEATIVSKFLDPHSYDVDRLALLSNGGKSTASEITVDTIMRPDNGLEQQTRSSSRWQLGLTSDNPVPSSHALLVLLEATVRAKINEDKIPISLGAESDEGHEVPLPSPTTPASLDKPLRPGVVVPALTFPGMESTVITAILKFPGLPDSFSPTDISAWLTAAN
jgi:hypothetical protein